MFIKPPQIIRFFFPSIVWKKENTQNNIWLTFDDGPCPQVTPFILNTLREEDVKATFFLIGEQIDKYPALYKQIMEAGHMIGNHSYSHKNSWTSNSSNYLNDIEKCQKLMPHNKLFRPPYGKIRPLQIKYLKRKYKIILWDILSWDFSASNSANDIKENVLANTVSGSIIVFHNNQQSFKKLKKILKGTIRGLKQKKFVFSKSW